MNHVITAEHTNVAHSLHPLPNDAQHKIITTVPTPAHPQPKFLPPPSPSNATDMTTLNLHTAITMLNYEKIHMQLNYIEAFLRAFTSNTAPPPVPNFDHHTGTTNAMQKNTTTPLTGAITSTTLDGSIPTPCHLNTSQTSNLQYSPHNGNQSESNVCGQSTVHALPHLSTSIHATTTMTTQNTIKRTNCEPDPHFSHHVDRKTSTHNSTSSLPHDQYPTCNIATSDLYHIYLAAIQAIKNADIHLLSSNHKSAPIVLDLHPEQTSHKTTLPTPHLDTLPQNHHQTPCCLMYAQW